MGMRHVHEKENGNELFWTFCLGSQQLLRKRMETMQLLDTGIVQLETRDDKNAISLYSSTENKSM